MGTTIREIVFAVGGNPWHILLLPIPIAALLLLALGAGFFLALLYVYFRDIAHIYDVLAFLLWVTTPVFYPLVVVPDHVRPFLYFNPLVPIVQSLRDVVLHPRLESPGLLAVDMVVGIAVCAAGWASFRLLRRQLVDLL